MSTFAAPTAHAAPHHQAHSAAASRSVASAWERLAALDDEAVRAVDAIAASLAHRPRALPAHLRGGGGGGAQPHQQQQGGAPGAAAAAAAAEAGASPTASAPAGTAAAAAPQQQQQQQAPAPPPPPQQQQQLQDGGGDLFSSVLHNAQQFHAWLDRLDRACATEAQRKHGRFAARLTRAAAGCADVAGRLEGTVRLLDGVSELQRAAARRSEELAGTCDALVAERAALADLASALRARLALFDDYEAAAAELAQAAAAEAAAAAAAGGGEDGGGPASSSASAAAADAGGGGLSTDALIKVLARLDGVAARVAAHPHYADAAAYAARLRGLQQRAAALVRGRVGAALRAAARAVAQAAAAEAQQQAEAGASAASATNPANAAAPLPPQNHQQHQLLLLPEAAEVSILGAKYRAAAEPLLRPLIAGLADLAAAQRRAGRAGGPDDCGRLLAECRALVAAGRAEVLAPFAAARAAALAREHDAAALLRGGGEQLLRAARQEAALMDALFGEPAVVAAMPVGSGFGGAAAAGAGRATATATPFQQQQPGQPTTHHRTAADAAADALRVPLDPLASGFYDALRPRVVKLSDVDAICALIDVLQGELLLPSEQAAGAEPDSAAAAAATPLLHASAAAAAARPVLERALADLRGRLIFRAQAVVSEAVAGWDASGLADYPERLEALRRKKEKKKSKDASGEAAEAAPGASPKNDADDDDDEDDDEEEQGGDDAILIVPPVREALSLLAKLYRRLDGRTFGGLAQEAVAAACQSVLGPGSRALAARHGTLDAQLFAVAHLLHLRERIGAFEGADFAAVEVDLDFSHMYGHVRRLLIGGGAGAAAAAAAGAAAGAGGSLGLLGTATSGVASLLLRSQPSPSGGSAVNAAAAGMTGAAAAGGGAVRALSQRLDAKRDLERALRATCEDLIMSLTRQAADPLVAFLTKAAAASAGAGAVGGAGAAAKAKPLREHVFAGADRVAEAVAAAHAALDAALPAAARRAALYLPSASTRSVLLRPVRSNVSEAYSQVRAVVEREYGGQERAAIGLRSQEALEAALAALAA